MHKFRAETLESLYQMEESGLSNLVMQLVHEYETSSGTFMANLLDGFEKKDFAQLEMAAHTLYSSSKMLGLEQLAENCAQIEKSAKAQQAIPVDVPAMPALYQESLQLLKEHTAKKCKKSGA